MLAERTRTNGDSRKIAFDIEDVKPLRDKIATSIRESIIDGRIKPGERLMEPDVAKMLGVSRTPLREAFFQLESEGFVKVTPRRGAVVSELSVKDAEEIYSIKSALEGLAARLAAKNMSEEDLAELEALTSSMEKKSADKLPDHRAILELNAQFHQVINRASGNEKLLHLVNLLRRQTLRYNYIYLSVMSHIQRSVQEHRDIISALRRQDAATAERLISSHGENAGKSLCDYIRTMPHPHD